MRGRSKLGRKATRKTASMPAVLSVIGENAQMSAEPCEQASAFEQKARVATKHVKQVVRESLQF